MLGQTLEVLLLLANALPELEELLLLTLADGVVLAGLLSSLESITIDGEEARVSIAQGGQIDSRVVLTLGHPFWGVRRYLPRPWCEQWWKR